MVKGEVFTTRTVGVCREWFIGKWRHPQPMDQVVCAARRGLTRHARAPCQS